MFDILIRLWNEVWYFPFMVALIHVLGIFVIIDYIFRFISSFVNRKKKNSQPKEKLEKTEMIRNEKMQKKAIEER